jgi:hypothetical protein
MQAYSKKSLTNGFIFAKKAPRPRQQLSTTTHLDYREQGYHDSLHSAEVAQLYPQVGDSITRR